MSHRYITTTLPYVNDHPHMGHVLEFVQADVLARYFRLMGHEVFFSTGTDEHGQKILEKAREAGEEVQAYVDRYAASFMQLKETLALSYDTFIRTTDPKHKEAAQELWSRCMAQGDIYKKKYKGLYCVGCEKFLNERDLEGGKCPLHPKQDPQVIEEENYFFALSKYQRGLLDYLSREDVIVPKHRREEAKVFVSQGLEDFSISREKSRMAWGVPVPDDESQVMYVWFDALTNYISTLGWPTDERFSSFWENGHTLQFAGKDQVRFQSIMWQAMLMSANIKNTDTVFYHGFITSGGQKMSKSIGNVINPLAVVEKYGTDATRYILLRHVHPTDDTDITEEKMAEWYEANLVNGLGNLVARVMKLAETHLEKPITRPEPSPFPREYVDALGAFDFNRALDVVWEKIGALDEQITNKEPFKLVKTDPEEGRRMISEMATELYVIGRMLYPFMPSTNETIKRAVLENRKPENLFPRTS